MESKKYNPEEIYPTPEEKTDKNQNPQESENNAFILEQYKIIRKGKSEDFIPIQIAAILGFLSLLPASSPAPIINYGFSLLSVIAVSYSLKAANKFEIETGRKSKAKIWAEIKGENLGGNPINTSNRYFYNVFDFWYIFCWRNVERS